MEINIILTAVLTALSVALITSGTFVLIYIMEKRRITRAFRAFFESPDEETPSQFAELIDAIGATIARRMVAQIKTTVMGMNSVDSKNASREAIEGIKGASPSLAGLASLLPKKWVKSPEIMGVLAGFLGKIGKPGNGNQEPIDGTTQNMFKFWR